MPEHISTKEKENNTSQQFWFVFNVHKTCSRSARFTAKPSKHPLYLYVQAEKEKKYIQGKNGRFGDWETCFFAFKNGSSIISQ